jgi:V-type H+-transporting ATPase subunit a
MEVADNLTAWFTTVRKEKGIYHTMNLLNYDSNRKCLIAEGWCAKSDAPIVHLALKNAINTSGTNLPTVIKEIDTKRKPPTYHRTNRFTEGFQTIIDAYGIARYREVNPGLFTIISFPFLFAIMFGDIGHGFLMFLFALYLVLNEKKLASVKDEIFTMFFGGRYMMLMMGIFSIFTGCIYNDIFSLSLNVFKSGFDWPSNYTSTETVEGIPNGQVYAFGFDPVSRIILNSFARVIDNQFLGMAWLREFFAFFQLVQDETSHHHWCYSCNYIMNHLQILLTLLCRCLLPSV